MSACVVSIVIDVNVIRLFQKCDLEFLTIQTEVNKICVVENTIRYEMISSYEFIIEILGSFFQVLVSNRQVLSIIVPL